MKNSEYKLNDAQKSVLDSYVDVILENSIEPLLKKSWEAQKKSNRKDMIDIVKFIIEQSHKKTPDDYNELVDFVYNNSEHTTINSSLKNLYLIMRGDFSKFTSSEGKIHLLIDSLISGKIAKKVSEHNISFKEEVGDYIFNSLIKYTKEENSLFLKAPVEEVQKIDTKRSNKKSWSLHFKITKNDSKKDKESLSK